MWQNGIDLKGSAKKGEKRFMKGNIEMPRGGKGRGLPWRKVQIIAIIYTSLLQNSYVHASIICCSERKGFDCKNTKNSKAIEICTKKLAIVMYCVAVIMDPLFVENENNISKDVQIDKIWK